MVVSESIIRLSSCSAQTYGPALLPWYYHLHTIARGWSRGGLEGHGPKCHKLWSRKHFKLGQPWDGSAMAPLSDLDQPLFSVSNQLLNCAIILAIMLDHKTTALDRGYNFQELKHRDVGILRIPIVLIFCLKKFCCMSVVFNQSR